MEMKELEVKEVSREFVKPWSPTPPHLGKFTLSLLDQLFPSYYIPILFFYPENNKIEISVTHLKSALSQTLSQFYPLAGRFNDDSTLTCNDEGVLFFETHVHCRLSTLKSPKREWLHKLLPPRELLPIGAQHISQAPQFAFQANVFLDGGLVIGCYVFHKMLDIVSLSNFLRHWAYTTVHGPNTNPIQPDFNAALTAFPPSPEPPRVHKPDSPTPNIMDVKIVGKTFNFNNVALNKLKTQAISERVPNPTRFEALSGFIWTHILKAIKPREHVVSSVTFPVNIRGRASSPQLPKESIGNLNVQLIIRAHERAGFQERVAEIHNGVVNATSEILKEYEKGIKGVVGYQQTIWDEMSRLNNNDSNMCLITSWWKVGLDEVDFGFGKPEWIVPIDGRIIPGSNTVVLTDYTHPSGDASAHGITAWLHLSENAMQNLESNVDFLAFASPQPQW